MIHYFVLEFLFLVFAYLIAGINGLVFVIFHSFVSIILLELVNYIQHYGLERKKKMEDTKDLQIYILGTVVTSLLIGRRLI